MNTNVDTIDEFVSKYRNEDTPDSPEIFQKWKADRLLNESVVGGIALADLFHEDGLRDEIPESVLGAFKNLTNGEVSTYAEARDRIASQIGRGDGVSQQWISTIKGRIGENQFRQNADELSGGVRLAEESNQEAYDIIYTSPQGNSRFIDVKTTDDPGYVVEEMQSVQQRISAGEIKTPDGNFVREVEFAVPESTADQVRETATDHGIELDSADADVGLIPMETSTKQATDAVEAGVGAVGPEAIENLFQEVATGTVAVGTLHGLVQGFLVYKGSKQMNQALADATEETALSSAGLTAGFVVESAFREAALVGEPMAMATVFGTSVAVRMVLNDFVKRSDYARWMKRKRKHLSGRVAKLESL